MQSATHADLVEKEVDKVISKFSEYHERASLRMEELIQRAREIQQRLEDYEKDINANEEPPRRELNLLIAEIKKRLTELSSSHKELHSAVSKVGKTVDKNFASDYECVSHEHFLTGNKQQILDEILCNHYSREGLHNVTNLLAEEAGVTFTDDSSSPYTEIIHIVAALRERNLEPALEWALKNKDKLDKSKSSLEFMLHKMKYLLILNSGPENVIDAIEYAKIYLKPYFQQYEKVIQMLFGCVLYGQIGLAKSPYSYLLESSAWESLCQVFTKDVCAILGISVESPLSVALDVGCGALPILLSIKEAMDTQNVTMWSTKEELPVEINVKPQCRYHSIFACPILRQQGTQANPPMKLVCGHVISKDALNKLLNANKLKCPYCPVEQTGDEATFIYF